MKLLFTESAWGDYAWIAENNRKLLKRLNTVIRDAMRSPFTGIGKPEPLKANLSGYWSRRITAEHRLVYLIEGDELRVISCRFHYRN
ncbi:MAG: Txe/YoeB family addiction module toxin [Gammaproteobacteria bacterium]|nr:Txe/YoeB family addiction module toxin [Gammaproteobacteria bacterium]